MDGWHRSGKADMGIRALGVVLLALSAVAIMLLTRSMAGRSSDSATAVDYLLAAFGFVAASCGVLSACLGRHLFDEIEVSPRWRRRHDDDDFWRDRLARAAPVEAPRIPPPAWLGDAQRCAA